MVTASGNPSAGDLYHIQGNCKAFFGRGTCQLQCIPVTTVSVDTYDLSDVRIRRRLKRQQDGSYLSSRRNGNNLYLFTSYAPDTTEGADAKSEMSQELVTII